MELGDIVKHHGRFFDNEYLPIPQSGIPDHWALFVI